VAAAYPDAPKDTLDGLSVDCGDFWFNVRPSNTEPLLRLNLEAVDADTCARATDEVLALIRGE
jgi:phosphomannomutase